MISNEIRVVLQRVGKILNKHNVDYMIVGGVAVGYYGYQRVSGISSYSPGIKVDVDFWYKPTTENYVLLLAALAELNVNIESLSDKVFDPQTTFLKISHNNFHTDFLPQMAGLRPYRDCKRDAIREILDGNELYLISIEDLIANIKSHRERNGQSRYCRPGNEAKIKQALIAQH